MDSKNVKKFEKFEDFTNLYELSKTLRFELKPIGNTQKMLEDEKVFEKDETIHNKYIKTKPFFDKLHREFVDEALADISLSGLDEYLKLLKEWKVDKKNKEKQKTLEKNQEKLREEIVGFFNTKAKSWAENKYSDLGLKNKDTEILFEEGVFKLLKHKYGKEKEAEILDEASGEMISIFHSWKGFVGYFDKFHATRKNFYKADGTTTALATRIIDQNLKRFCDNLDVYESVKNKIVFSELEKELSAKLDNVFNLNYYNICVLQAGIDRYNEILGGKTEENGEKKKGMNELINKYRQDNKGEKVQFFKPLDKQILSEKEKFIPEIKDDRELLLSLKDFYQTSEEKINILKNLFGRFVSRNDDFSLNEIYLSKEAFNTISHKWTSETEVFEKALYEEMKADKSAGLKYEKEDNSYRFPNFIALSYIKNSLAKLKNEKFWKEKYYKAEEDQKGFLAVESPNFEQFLKIFEFEFNSLFKGYFIDQKTGEEIEIGYNIFNGAFKKLVESKDFSKNKENTAIIKDFADSVLTIYQMAKYFAAEKKRAWDDSYELDNLFYKDPVNGYLEFYKDAYSQIVQKYNLLRNYLTKKPFSDEKWKLNFENPTLADGWDKNKESDNSAVILKKEGKYYFGLMRSGYNNIFSDKFKQDFLNNIEGGKYEKIVYKYFPDQAKMFPKVCFSEKGRNSFNPPKEIIDVYERDEFKKGDSFSIKSMHLLIDFYKDCLNKYEGWKCYSFKNLKPTKEYKNNIGEFFRDVAVDGYKISTVDISDSYISERNQKGELYLFEIKNKDFGEKAVGKKNLHTIYFENIFSSENRENGYCFKLNGQAEIFYRPKSIEIEKEKRNFSREIIKNKRYTEDKIFFHCPIALNRGKDDEYQFNQKVNNFIASSKDIKIIGVDRGEKHLAYYSVVDQSGKKIESGSLNIIDNGKNKVDYAEKLESKAIGREQARRDWQDVEGIKNLKKGYVSQVVRKLADLAIKHTAIVVFEDLNMRFKQIRGGIEKSAYQQLEKGLIDKLSFLVNKEEKNPEKAGNLLKAYQLAAPFTAFKDMGKQTGIIFYTEARYTSKIDPVTGWRPSLYLKYTNASSAKKDILKFNKIEFNKEKKRFEFAYDIKKFNDKKEYPKKTEWTVCSCVERFFWSKSLNQNKGGYNYFKDLTENFENLFSDSKVDYKDADILAQVENMDEKGNERFFKDFIFLFKLICQIRNTDEKAVDADKKDFILSPVEPFFDSRKAAAGQPNNGDENGAYNIARKGIVVINKIKEIYRKSGSCEKMNWGDLYVSDKDWDDFVQKT